VGQVVNLRADCQSAQTALVTVVHTLSVPRSRSCERPGYPKERTRMSNLPHSPATRQDFLLLPERPETGQRYELHDGEVVVVPPARPLHIKLQKRIEQLLEASARDLGVVTIEFPYRPILNLQFWFAPVT
jgi:hypothetical protein